MASPRILVEEILRGRGAVPAVLTQDQGSVRSAGSLSAEEVEATLEEILARPEYAPAEPPLLLRWIGSALRWVGELISGALERIAPDLDFTGPGWETFGLALLGLGGLLGLALLGYLLYLAARALRRRRRRIAAVGAPPSEVRPTTAKEWETLAREAADREDWRAAAMALYQAALLRLGAAGVVVTDRAKTPGDYRRAVRRGTPGLAGTFERFLRAFERTAYGAAPPDRARYDAVLEASRQLDAARREHTARPEASAELAGAGAGVGRG